MMQWTRRAGGAALASLGQRTRGGSHGPGSPAAGKGDGLWQRAVGLGRAARVSGSRRGVRRRVGMAEDTETQATSAGAEEREEGEIEDDDSSSAAPRGALGNRRTRWTTLVGGDREKEQPELGTRAPDPIAGIDAV